MSTIVERAVSAESAKHYIDGIVSLAKAEEGEEIRTLISRLREKVPPSYQNHQDISRVIGEIEKLSTQTPPNYKLIGERLNHLGCAILSYYIRAN